MKRKQALALFEAHKHADVPEFLDGKMDFQQAAFLSGIAAGKRDDVEILNKRASILYAADANETAYESECCAEHILKSLKELEAGT